MKQYLGKTELLRIGQAGAGRADLPGAPRAALVLTGDAQTLEMTGRWLQETARKQMAKVDRKMNEPTPLAGLTTWVGGMEWRF